MNIQLYAFCFLGKGIHRLYFAYLNLVREDAWVRGVLNVGGYFRLSIYTY